MPEPMEVAVSVTQPINRARMYVAATIITAGLAVVSIVVLAIVKPDNTSAGTLILGVLLPLITAFLAASVGHVGSAVDGRLSQLLELTEKSSRAEGKLAEKDAAASQVRPRRASDLAPAGPVKVEVVNAPLPVVVGKGDDDH